MCDTIRSAWSKTARRDDRAPIGTAPQGTWASPSQIAGLMASDAARGHRGFGWLLDGLANTDFATCRSRRAFQVLKRWPPRPRGQARDQGLRTYPPLLQRCPDSRGATPTGSDSDTRGRSRPARRRRGPQDDRRRGAERRRSHAAADVCVVGSGAGGGVMAAEMTGGGKSPWWVPKTGAATARAGLQAARAARARWSLLGGGPAGIRGGSISGTRRLDVGGGTVVNYMNCIRTPEHVPQGVPSTAVEGIDTSTTTQHIDAVGSASGECGGHLDKNRSHRKMIEGWRSAAPVEADHPQRGPKCDRPAACAAMLTAACQRGLQA